MTRCVLLAATALMTALVLSGCEVGPNYKGPPVAAPIAAHATHFLRADSAASDAPQAQWWGALGDKQLSQLIDEALAHAPDLASARARVVQSRAGLKGARLNQLPTTGASAAYLRSKGLSSLLGSEAASASGGDEAFQIYTANLDATWEPDLFGGKARAVEGAKAQAEAAQAALQGAEVSLAAEVAQRYVTLRQLQAHLALSQRDADAEGRLLQMTQLKQAGGTASDLDVEQLRNQLASTQAQVVPLAAQIAEQLDRLAVLTAKEPGSLDAELSPAAPIPLPPSTIAVGDPAMFLRRRPDIRQAERRIAQQSALIGQHTADLFPKVTLVGTIGYTAPELSQLFNSNNSSYAVAPFLQWTPFDFGRIRAQIAQARGARDEALADYRKTVLDALQDAETALARYGRQRDRVDALIKVQASADRAASLMAIRLQGGTATTLDVVDVERQRVQAQLGVSDAQAELTEDFVSLQKSLGLGWSG